MAGMLGIGLSGLNVAQLQLNTTSHNIANANTAGYSRQTVQLLANDPQFAGAGFFGRGVQVGNVTRQYNQFLESQVQNSDNRRSEYAAFSAQISQINNLIADPAVGLTPVMNNFFAAAQEVAANPTSIPARQALLSAGQDVAGRFQAMDGRLNEIREGTESEIGATVERINSIAFEISELNQRISLAQAAGTGVSANDLQDQRNNKLGELNQLIKARGIIEADGQMSVFIGTGQSLVLGRTITPLTTITDPADPTRQSIALIAPNGNEIPLAEKVLTGGALGGLLAFRRESLDVTQNRFNLLARTFVEAVNAQHREGRDLDGLSGGNLFVSTMVRPESVPGGSAAPSVGIVNDGLLTSDSYLLTYDSLEASGYTLVRQSDGLVITDPVAELGFSITLPAAPTDGDSFIIEPLRNAASSLTVAITDPARIAAGLPGGSLASVSTASAATVELDAGQFFPGTGSVAPFAISFEDATNTLLLPPGYVIESGDPLVSDASYDPTDPDIIASGKNFTITTPEGETLSFTVEGTPADGDTFDFSFDLVATGPGDNRNALAIAALQTERIMLHSVAGTPGATLQSAYSQLVSQVGNKTREVQAGEKAQQSLLQQARDARDSFSGVNLDEEAANLIRFQQAYQASGRVMSIAQRLFDEVLSFGR